MLLGGRCRAPANLENGVRPLMRVGETLPSQGCSAAIPGRPHPQWKVGSRPSLKLIVAANAIDGRQARFTSRVFIAGRDSCYKFAMAPKARAEIERAQTLTHYPIGGELLTRIRYGDECFGRRFDMAPCDDCGVAKGQLHIPCCDVEECPNCHTQLLSCDCDLGDACSAD